METQARLDTLCIGIPGRQTMIEGAIWEKA
jgi:hypothetical protein